MSVKTGALLLAGALTLLVIVSASAGNPGAIWTTTSGCGSDQQDVNHYSVGEHVFINGAGFDPGTYSWEIKGKSGGASGDPKQVVVSGNFTVDPTGVFCFDAYTVQLDDWGEYGVKFGNKGDNYRVEGKNECDDDDNGDDDDNHCPPQPTKTPVPTNTLVPTNTDVPTATNTQVPPTNTSVPTNTPIPTNTGAPTNTPVATNTAGPTNTLVIPTNTPKATQTAGSPTATPTATNTLPPVIVVIEPTAPPSSPLAPFCEMNAVNATEDKRVEIAFTWRNAAAIVGTWGDGEPITGIPNQEAGFAVISHQYAADRQFAQILILAGKGAEKHLCTVNIVFDQQSAATAAPICGDSCEGSQADNQTQSQSQSQEINIGLFSGDSPDSGAAWLWCLVGLLAFFALLAFTAVIASALRR